LRGAGGIKSAGFPQFLKPIRVAGDQVIEKRAAFDGDIRHNEEYNETTGMGRQFVEQLKSSEGEGFGQGQCQIGVGLTAKQGGVAVDHCKCIVE